MRPTVKLSEVGEIVTGTTPSKKEPKYWGGSVPFVKPPHLGTDKPIVETEETLTEKGSKKGNLIPKNSIMVCCIGSLGKIGIAGKDLCTNQQINSIIFNDKLVDFKYGYYFCTTLENVMNRMANQALIQIINKSSFSNIEIPLPPLETQKAIVAKLDQIFAELDQTKSEIQKNLDNTDELWKSALNQAFQGDWEMKKLGDCVYSVGSGRSKERSEKGEYPIYGSTGIISRTDNFVYDKKQILIARVGANAGYIHIAEGKYDVSDNTLIVDLKENLNLGYFYYLLTSMNLNQYTNGGGQPLITATQVKNLEIPVPPLSEQEKIVEHLDQVSKEVKALKSQYQSQLDNLEELKKSVLDKAFRGELGE